MLFYLQLWHKENYFLLVQKRETEQILNLGGRGGKEVRYGHCLQQCHHLINSLFELISVLDPFCVVKAIIVIV